MELFVSRPLLFVGDIHLGRSPHRLAAAGLDPRRLDPAEAWRRVLRYALDHDVQAVVLAGDVVDQDKDRFEAFGHLHAGVARLVAAGIAVVGVAGNHDSIALPRLASRIAAFQLLGAGGRWQRVELDGVDLIGWSFPARHHQRDPLHEPGLAEALASRRDAALCLGVLHTDLDGGNSPYAPTGRLALDAQPLAGWFLGHIHQPDDLAVGRPIGYLGSLVGLDRGETGPRGPWLITPTSATRLTAEQLPLGPVHWTSMMVDVSRLDLAAAGHDVLHDALMARVSAEAETDAWLIAGDFAAVGCTITFTGRTDQPSVLARFITEREATELVFPVADIPWVVVSMQVATQPALDLDALAAEPTPLGQVARLVLALNTDGAAAMPQLVQAELASFDPSPWSTDMQRAPLPDPVLTTRVAAMALLEQLLRQRAAQTDVSVDLSGGR